MQDTDVGDIKIENEVLTEMAKLMEDASDLVLNIIWPQGILWESLIGRTPTVKSIIL